MAGRRSSADSARALALVSPPTRAFALHFCASASHFCAFGLHFCPFAFPFSAVALRFCAVTFDTFFAVAWQFLRDAAGLGAIGEDGRGPGAGRHARLGTGGAGISPRSHSLVSFGRCAAHASEPSEFESALGGAQHTSRSRRSSCGLREFFGSRRCEAHASEPSELPAGGFFGSRRCEAHAALPWPPPPRRA